jgi:ATP synthase protein I
MAPSDPDNQKPAASALPEIVGRKQQRRLEARRRPERNIWFGLGMFGLVGWSIAVPTLIGVALGAWIDHRWPSRYSWTLMLLLLGVAIGCLHAWQWVHRESELEEPPAGALRGDQPAKDRR